MAREYDSRPDAAAKPPTLFQIFGWRRRPGTGATATRCHALGADTRGGWNESARIGDLRRESKLTFQTWWELGGMWNAGSATATYEYFMVSTLLSRAASTHPLSVKPNMAVVGPQNKICRSSRKKKEGVSVAEIKTMAPLGHGNGAHAN